MKTEVIPHEISVSLIEHSLGQKTYSALVDTGAERSCLRVCRYKVNEDRRSVFYVPNDSDVGYSQSISNFTTIKTSTGSEQRPIVQLTVRYNPERDPVTLECSLSDADMTHDMVLGGDFLQTTGLAVQHVATEGYAGTPVTQPNTTAAELVAQPDEDPLAPEPEPAAPVNSDESDDACDRIVSLILANPTITIDQIVRKIRTKIVESIQ